MIDTLKAIGIPVTAAAVISALVVSVPLLFKIDERYAKEEDLRTEVAALKQTNNELQRELAQLAGFQKAMTQFIAEGRIPRPSVEIAPIASAPVEVPPSAIFAPPAPASAPVTVPAKPSAALEKPRNWRELNEGLARQQQRLVLPRE